MTHDQFSKLSDSWDRAVGVRNFGQKCFLRHQTPLKTLIVVAL